MQSRSSSRASTRASSFFFIGLIVLMAATAVCGVGAYSFARRTAVDLGSGGVQVASLGDVLRAVANPDAVGRSSGGDFESFLAVQPTTTPRPTALPVTPTRPADAAAQTAEVQPIAVAPPTDAPTDPPGEVSANAEPAADPNATADPLAGYTWNDPRRVNILVMGIDQRGDEPGPFRTDTMIVVSIDPVRQMVGMLSVPRDLWVPIPGYQDNRINTANYVGDADNYPGGGPALAARTITENLGIPVERYIRVNFDVFTRVVELVAPEGVEVCPREVIDDPDYPDAGYGTIPVRFDPGCQTLQAERLLQYARTRATEGSDFDRAARQQEVIRALREEVLSAGGLARFFTQIPALWDELSGAYQTNLTLEELISLANLAQSVPRENIHSGVINNLYVSFATTAANEQVLIPNYNAIRTLIQDVFNPIDDSLTLDDLRERAAEENAEIVVYNNTSVTGLAGRARDWLAGQGVTISAVGNSNPITNEPTLIRNYTGRIWTARYLAELLGLPQESIQPGADRATTADVMVVVGADMEQIMDGAGAPAAQPTSTP